MSGHAHSGGHRLRPVIVSRRVFLTDLGRGVAAATVFSTTFVACSSSGDGDLATSPTAAVPRTTPTPVATTAAAAAPTETVTAAAPAAPATSPPTSAVATNEPATSAPAAELEWRRASLGFVSAYVLLRGGEAAIVDTGIAGSAPAILEALGALGSGWGDVGHVILTHNHPDHIGGLGEVFDAAADAVGYAGVADLGGITSSRTVKGVAEGDLVFGLQVIETPGHTPGSISLLDSGTGLLLVGDALNGGADGAIEPPNPQFSSDMELATASARKLAGFDFSTAVFGHGDPSEGDAAARLAELVAGL